MLSARFSPMTPRPISPNCSVCGVTLMADMLGLLLFVLCGGAPRLSLPPDTLKKRWLEAGAPAGPDTNLLRFVHIYDLSRLCMLTVPQQPPALSTTGQPRA